ncbi:MAG: 3-oxoacyl-[acyl-carrier-protein] reductase [Clostridiales bacterium]|jgi:3-oxoacyl-[acyl-carrier protein] reductase|nr:3-oxoacyl-[acyl-carrier-protein] reductase [Clostridiales bacterium]
MTALVTGASRGIGRAIAVAFAERGHDVAVNYASGADSARETVKLCEARGVRAVAFACDVSRYAACQEMVGKAEEALGGVDILVNNAGITRDGLLMRMSEERFDEVYSVNLKSVYNLSRLVVAGMMKKRWGRVISLSSVAGLYGNAGQVNYSAMKAAVIGFTKSLAKEVGSRGITVNAIAPGFIETDMTAALPEKAREEALARIALGRFGQAEEVAKTAAFLASDDAAYITGHTIEVSGGISL